jgi:hypothetical protein
MVPRATDATTEMDKGKDSICEHPRLDDASRAGVCRK